MNLMRVTICVHNCSKKCAYVEKNRWQLEGVTKPFHKQGTTVNHQPSMEWRSALNLGIWGITGGAGQMSDWIFINISSTCATTIRRLCLMNCNVEQASVSIRGTGDDVLALPFASHQRREAALARKYSWVLYWTNFSLCWQVIHQFRCAQRLAAHAECCSDAAAVPAIATGCCGLLKDARAVFNVPE